MLAREDKKPETRILQPLLHTGRSYYVLGGAMLIIVGWFGYAWITQLVNGLGVTSLRTPVGAAWGVYITNFVFYACMAHGGMAISAAVRLLNLNIYKPVARIGEVLTAVALMMAGLSIVIDLGRPDRSFNMVLFWPQRIATSPLSWDITVIVLYMTLSITYLWLTMRKDLYHYADRFKRRGILYRLLSLGYHPDQDQKIDRTSWWLSLAILILIVMLSGGVIPWIFGLLPSRPGWFGAMAGPYFLTAALATSIAAVIVITSVLRKVYHWQSYIDEKVFRGLGVILGALTHFYVYMVIAEQITMRYAAPHAEVAISKMLLEGDLAIVFWPMLVLGLALPSVMLVFQVFRPGWFSLSRTVIAAVIILIAFWIKRFLIVVPSLLRPVLPFPTGSYNPSWVEWSVVAGTLALVVLLYMAYLKLFPIMELDEE